MKLLTFSCLLVLGLTAFTAPVEAATKRSAAAQPSGKKVDTHAAMDGIIFKNYPYTILTVKAMSYRDSVDGEFDHTLVLRFHRDNSKRVDIKVLAPGEKRDTWTHADEWGTYGTVDKADGYEKAKWHYVLVDGGVNDLQLHVQRTGTVTNKGNNGPTCSIRLIGSSYTYALGGGSRLFIYDMAENASIRGSDQ